jgi:hypothetical protein
VSEACPKNLAFAHVASAQHALIVVADEFAADLVAGIDHEGAYDELDCFS